MNGAVVRAEGAVKGRRKGLQGANGEGGGDNTALWPLANWLPPHNRVGRVGRWEALTHAARPSGMRTRS